MLGHHGYLRMQEGDVVEGGELLKEATESIAHLTGNHVLRAALLFHLGLFRCDTGRERGRGRGEGGRGEICREIGEGGSEKGGRERGEKEKERDGGREKAVSYTHLTLPTRR